MKDISDFLNAKKQRYIERAERLEEQKNAAKKRIANNEKAYGEIAGYPKAIIPDEHGRKHLQSIIVKQNELLAKVELIEELQEN